MLQIQKLKGAGLLTKREQPEQLLSSKKLPELICGGLKKVNIIN
jgi:hypothetical protein